MTRINQKKFKEALKDSGGNQSTIAQKIGVTRGAITHFINRNPKMRKLLEIEAERIIDVAENVIDHDIVKNKNIDSSKWKLLNSKRGKSRGYGPKTEMEHSTGKIFEVKITEVENESTSETGHEQKAKTSVDNSKG